MGRYVSEESFGSEVIPGFFFFNDTATTEIYTLSLHDALPISQCDAIGEKHPDPRAAVHGIVGEVVRGAHAEIDRKSTRLNSSHSQISYAVFCLKKKKTWCCRISVGSSSSSLSACSCATCAYLR